MIHYELKAVLSEYAGNHERELTAWVFGAESEYMPGGLPEDFPGNRPHAEAMAWAFDPEGSEGKLEMFAHEEYGMVWQDIGDDQDWVQEQWKKDPKLNYA